VDNGQGPGMPHFIDATLQNSLSESSARTVLQCPVIHYTTACTVLVESGAASPDPDNGGHTVNKG
jgi:hypothetical protein